MSILTQIIFTTTLLRVMPATSISLWIPPVKLLLLKRYFRILALSFSINMRGFIPSRWHHWQRIALATEAVRIARSILVLCLHAGRFYLVTLLKLIYLPRMIELKWMRRNPIWQMNLNAKHMKTMWIMGHLR